MKGQGKICFGLYKNSGDVLSKLKSRGFGATNNNNNNNNNNNLYI